MRKEDLTIHCVVKNEPFVYYAIKSVYNYCNTILLYDTGSTDKNTLNDIQQLIKEDIDNKIIFKQDIIDFDEHNWKVGGYIQLVNKNKNKRGVGQVRQAQIDNTKTKFFMIVDGDEVHYRDSMKNILEYNMPDNIIMAQLPLLWFYDMQYTFNCYSPTGRIFKTEEVQVRTKVSGDILVTKGAQQNLQNHGINVQRLMNLKPFAHFETYLKPFRRKHTILKKDLIKFNDKLPEVMLENTYYMDRFKNVK